MAGIGRHSRYWNDGLRPLYARVATTPSNLEYARTIAPTRSSPSCSSVTFTPSTVLVSQPLKADTFAPLLSPNSTTLLPKRPCFAPFPNESGNRTAGEHSRRKQKLSTDTFFRSLKIRLKPTVEQAAVLRRWMAAAQAHYNTAIDIINTTHSTEREERYLEGLRQDHLSYMNPEGTRDDFYWYQVMESQQICDNGPRIGFTSTKRKWREARSDGTGETTCEYDDDGLREAVHDVLSAEPDFEKMAPSARAVFKDMRWTQEPPRHILDAAVKEAIDARTTNLAKLSSSARTKKHHFRLQFRSLRNLTRTPTQSLILEATLPLDSKSKKKQGPISKFTAATTAAGCQPRSGTSARSKTDFMMHFATGTGGMKGLGPIRGTDSRATVSWLLSVGHTQHESRILWDKRTRKFFLIVRRVVQRPPDTKALSACDVVGFDPGVRCFQAFSCPDGRHGELLAGGRAELQRRARKVDRLQSIANQMKAAGGDFTQHQSRAAIKCDVSHTHRRKPHQRRRNIAARARRERVRKHEYTRNMHYEAIKEIFKLGNLAVMPVLETKSFCARAERRFGPEVAKSAYAWSHCTFFQRLWHKSQTTADAYVAFTCEPGTTKTCDACGCVRDDLGGAKVFACRRCGHVAGRDVGHASRGNILAAIGAATNTPWDGIIRDGQSRTTGSTLADADGNSPS